MTSVRIIDGQRSDLADVWNELLAFHRDGGSLIVLGTQAFSRQNDVSYLRSLGWLDAWEHAPAPEGGRLTVAPGWEAAAEFAPPPVACSSGLWHLAHSADPRGLMFNSATVASARLSFPLRYVDADGRTLTAPVVRLDPQHAGPILWLPFDAPDWLNSDSGRCFLAFAETALAHGRHRVTFRPSRGRFAQQKAVVLNWTVERDLGASEVELDLELTLIHMATGARKVFHPHSDDLHWQGALEPEGLWHAEARWTHEGRVEASADTGFWVISDDGIAKLLQTAPRLRADAKVTSDMLSNEGRPYPLHGVNYHVTDTFRRCFVEPNAWQNELDLGILQADGYNVLRTGNWQSFDQFFEPEGPLRDEVLSNLEAFFLNAAVHGFQVQFVLGAFVMNPWNRDQCPIHNPEERARTVAAFSSFAQRFGRWPHVQIDAVNEPSYSANGAWHLAKPSEDPHELAAWRTWLSSRYHASLEALRQAWRVAPDEAPSFETLTLPTDHRRYRRNYDRQDVLVDPRLADWYDFARETYSGWVGELRRAVRKHAPETLFMMGRDESLRVPAQQDEAAAGHLDVINFHQWHRDSVIFSEWAFNRVRGMVCCGQEMGTYPYGDRNNNPRLSESHRARILERKLAYSQGNWLQWQAWNDPFMLDSIERALGLYRADGTSTPLADTARTLARFDQEYAPLMVGRDETVSRILVVFPTSSYFSVDSEVVFSAMVRTVRALAERLRVEFDLVLEHLLHRPEQTGNPDLIIVPAALELGDSTWQRLDNWALDGKSVLVLGASAPWERVEPGYLREPLAGVESLALGPQILDVSFRRALDGFEPATLWDRGRWRTTGDSRARVISRGAGRFLACPLPVEWADDDEVLVKVLKWTFEICPPSYVYDLEHDPGPRLTVLPQVYREATRFTLVNEGAEASVVLRDSRFGIRWGAVIPEGQSLVVWVAASGVRASTHPLRSLS